MLSKRNQERQILYLCCTLWGYIFRVGFSYSNATENLIGDFVLDPTFQGQSIHLCCSPSLVDTSGPKCQGYKGLIKGTKICLHAPSQYVDVKPDTSLAT